MNQVKPGDLLYCTRKHVLIGGKEITHGDAILVLKISPYSNRHSDNPHKYDFIEGLLHDKKIRFARFEIFGMTPDSGELKK